MQFNAPNRTVGRSSNRSTRTRGRGILVGICPPLVAHLQPSVTVQPRQRSFDQLPVSPQPLARLLASLGYTALNAALAKRLPASGEVVPLVHITGTGLKNPQHLQPESSAPTVR